MTLAVLNANEAHRHADHQTRGWLASRHLIQQQLQGRRRTADQHQRCRGDGTQLPPGESHAGRRAGRTRGRLVRRPVQNTVHRRAQSAAGHRCHRRGRHRCVGEDRRATPQRLHPPLAGAWAEPQQRGQPWIAAAMHQTFQHLLLQWIKSGVAQQSTDAPDAFGEDRVVLGHQRHHQRMPIHLIWGDDAAARDRAIDALIKTLVDPAWSSINLSRLDGAEAGQAAQALEEARTPPFASGGRVVLLQRSPFCNACPTELADRFEASLELLADDAHLVLVNPAKPDGRLRTTKALQKRIKQGLDHEQRFQLPAVWDGAGQRQLVERTADALGLQLERDAIDPLVEAIGNDSARLESELRKLSLRATTINAALVEELVGGLATNALQVGDALLEGNAGEAIARWDALIDAGEPALRIVATLTGQIRGWLWVSLLEQQGERDVAVIAKAAGIGNPKRIYVMRKQLQGRPAKRFLSLLGRLLEVEARLKRGSPPEDAFRDGLLG